MNTAYQAPLRYPVGCAHTPAMTFPEYWSRAAELLDLPTDAMPQDLSITGAGLGLLLKRLQNLDTPHAALLLAMACMSNPHRAAWLQAEVGLHFGQLTAADLGTEVFQVLVGLLATFPNPGRTE